MSLMPPLSLVGDRLAVACVDGQERPYLSLDAAASTAALPAVAQRVADFLPMYSSVHRGAGYKSQYSTSCYEAARHAALRFAGREGRDDIAIICRNTTEAINHLAYRLQLHRDDVVLTTVVEHHANLLPWRRTARCRFVECDSDGTFEVADVVRLLRSKPQPRLLALTGASNITGWMPDLEAIVEEAHALEVPVLVDAAQLAPHRPLLTSADYLAFSGHKMYAPFGAGVLIGPRAAFLEGDPFLVGGGAVDLVELDEVSWTEPPDREEAGSPNVVGAVALHGAIEALEEVGWEALVTHDRKIARHLREQLSKLDGVRLLGPDLSIDTLPVASFVVDGLPHALVAARLAHEWAIGVRHGCFCAHPYLMRLLGLSDEAVEQYRSQVRSGDRRNAPGAVRASAGINTTEQDIERLVEALRAVVSGEAPVPYTQDPVTGDYYPVAGLEPWQEELRQHGSTCSPG